MPKHYDAFLVRRWALDDGAQRLEVTHIQSGARTLVSSLAGVSDWIAAIGTAERGAVVAAESCPAPRPPPELPIG